MKYKWTIAVLLGLVLILACANPVRIGLKGLKADLISLSDKIKGGKHLMEQVSYLEKQVIEKPSEEIIPEIDVLKNEIRELISLEMRLKALNDSLKVLEGNPRAPRPIKEEIPIIRDRVEKLFEDIEVLKGEGVRLEGLKAYIKGGKIDVKEKETVEKPEERIEEEKETERKKIEKKTY